MEIPKAYASQFAGIWSIASEYMPQSLVESGPVQRNDPVRSASEFNGEFSRSGDIAVIEIRGVLSKYGSYYSSSGSTLMARKRLTEAQRDDSISAVMLVIESPGGAVSGNLELARLVESVNSEKPVHAFIEDLGASAAYEIASQAGSISTNESSLVGSIGTYMVAYDFKAMFDEMGVKAILIKDGDFKGAGTFGTEVTDKQVENWQRLVTKMNDQFIAAVESGRKITKSQAIELADGRVHMASDALALGLVDHVESFAAAMDRLRNVSSNQRKKVVIMSDSTVQDGPKAATLPQLKAACPGATSEFLMSQLEAESTVDAAKDAFLLLLQQERDSAAAEAAEAKAKAEENAAEEAKAREEAKRLAQHSEGGNTPILGKDGQQETSRDPVKAWSQAVSDHVKEHKVSRAQAVVSLKIENPEFYGEYMEACSGIKPRSPVASPSAS